MKKKTLLMTGVLLAAFFLAGVQINRASDFSVLNFESAAGFLLQNTRYGSLAIDRNQGSRYGFSYNYSTQDAADDKALAECGRGCYVVEQFTACAAYAADQAEGSTVYGWAYGADGTAVQNRALRECQNQGGSRCIVRVWACNSR